MTEFATLAGVAAATAVGYSIFKESSDKPFDMMLNNGSAGANSWPERWPEDWLEKHGDGSLPGAWSTHPPDYRLKKRFREFVKKADPGEFSSDDGAPQTYFPFDIEWDVMKLDLEKADSRLAARRVAMERELTELATRRQKARAVYVEAAAHAEAAPKLRDIRHRRHVENGNETGSLSDPEEAADQVWTQVAKRFEEERRAIEDKYRSDVAGYNLTAHKTARDYPGRFWMRDVRIVPKTGRTRHKVEVRATLTVSGGKVSDQEDGCVRISVEWTEKHRLFGEYTWREHIVIDVAGKILSGTQKLRERFGRPAHGLAGTPAPATVRPVGSDEAEPMTRIAADAAKRRLAAEKAHREQDAFAEIPGVPPRITTDLSTPPPPPPVPAFLTNAKPEDLVARRASSVRSMPSTPRGNTLAVPQQERRTSLDDQEIRRLAAAAADRPRRTSTESHDAFVTDVLQLRRGATGAVKAEKHGTHWRFELDTTGAAPRGRRAELTQHGTNRYTLKHAARLQPPQRAALRALFAMKHITLTESDS